MRKLADNFVRLLNGGIEVPVSAYRYDLRKWAVNPSQPEGGITVEAGKVTVSRFKPNEWIIKTTETKDAAGICAESANLRLSMRGFAANAALFTTANRYSHASTVWGSGGTVGKMLGLCVMPWCTSGYAAAQPELPCSAYVWDSLTYTDGTTCQVASETTALRGNAGGGYNGYGWTGDGENRRVLPGWKSFPCPWNSWQLSLGLYTAAETDEEGFITLDEPIEVELWADGGIDPSWREAWKVCDSEGAVYVKERTVENCWLAHGMAKEKNVNPDADGEVWTRTAVNFHGYAGTNRRLPGVKDWKTHQPQCVFHCVIANTEFWDEVKAWTASGAEISFPQLLKESNIGGELTVKTALASWCSSEEAYTGTLLTKIHFNMTGRSFTSGHRMFRGARQLETLTHEGGAVVNTDDLSGCFEGCSSLKSIDAGFVAWGTHSAEKGNIGWMFDYCRSLAQAGAESERAQTLYAGKYAESAFRGCSALTAVWPVIDMTDCPPGNAGEMFSGCAALSNLRLKGLGGGTWDFSGGTHGTLEALDADSVGYLLDNLRTPEDGESWTLKCPSAWSAKADAEKLAAARAKGWTVNFV